MTDVLIDDQKYDEVCNAVFKSVDIDQEGMLDKDELKYFITDVLRGITCDEEHESIGDF